MNFGSTPFLFLFLPAVIIIYYLIPRKKDLWYRNCFLLLASLFFYTWGEPIFVFLLLGMILLTWCFGKMAVGKKETSVGKTAVFLTVIVNLAVLIIFGQLELILDSLSQILGKDFSFLMTELPIGFSFFAFSSISYVVDIYRGQCPSDGSLFQAALYTSVFFKVLQGPIIAYRRFEMQISDRKASIHAIENGIWRFSIGLCKKIIIADNLSIMVEWVLASDFSRLALGDAWLGCIAYLVYLYFDLSAYADMAIGLGALFGFSLPENFNYPYLSTSISEFWRRWHITLCVWFTEYLYYPILLGPSVKFRKFLKEHKVQAKRAKTLQNIFVIGTVWLATALWHGMNLNYLIWGFLNATGILIEPYIKPMKNKKLNGVIRHAGMLLFLFVSMPLISIDSFQDALLYYQAMLTGTAIFTDGFLLYLMDFRLYLILGIIGCFPVLPTLKKKFLELTETKTQILWDILAGILLMMLVLISIYYSFTRDTATFLYQQ